MRKARLIQKEAKQAFEKLQELEVIAKQAQAEEEATLKTVTERIDVLCLEHGLSCGILINPDTLLEIIRQMVEGKTNVKIKYNLFFIDNE